MSKTINTSLKYEANNTSLEAYDYTESHLNPNEDIISPQLARQLQARVSIFNAKKNQENFNNMLAKFL